MAELMLMPAVIMGIILGIIEIEFVHNDERSYGLRWLTHALHALPVMFIFILISMNFHWAFSLVGIDLHENIMIDLIIRAVIGVIAAIKISLSASLVSGRAFGEKLWHSLVIGALVAVSPYLWQYLVAPFVTNIPWLQ